MGSYTRPIFTSRNAYFPSTWYLKNYLSFYLIFYYLIYFICYLLLFFIFLLFFFCYYFNIFNLFLLVVGIDSVDDESKLESPFISSMLPENPSKWDNTENPPYPYWCYYKYANLAAINRVRKAKGFTVLDFR